MKRYWSEVLQKHVTIPDGGPIRMNTAKLRELLGRAKLGQLHAGELRATFNASIALLDEVERLRDVAGKAHDFAALTLAFHGRDRGTDRQDRMLDGLEDLARELDAAARAALGDKP